MNRLPRKDPTPKRCFSFFCFHMCVFGAVFFPFPIHFRCAHKLSLAFFYIDIRMLTVPVLSVLIDDTHKTNASTYYAFSSIHVSTMRAVLNTRGAEAQDDGANPVGTNFEDQLLSLVVMAKGKYISSLFRPIAHLSRRVYTFASLLYCMICILAS